MNPVIWGPSGWKFLHIITMCYPDNPNLDDKNNMYNFFYSVKDVLPCQKCKDNFNEHLRIHPLNDKVLSSKEELVKWLIDIHNIVNKQNNKKELSYEKAIESIKNDNNPVVNWKYVMGVFIVLFLVILFLVTKLLYYQ